MIHHLKDPETWRDALFFGVLLLVLVLIAYLAAPAHSATPTPTPAQPSAPPPPPPPPAPKEPETPEEVRAEIERSAKEHGIDAERAVRVAYCESKFDPNARNRSGATGVYQFIDGGTGSARGDIKRAHEWMAAGRWSAWSQCLGGRGGGRSVPALEICVSHAHWSGEAGSDGLTWTVVAEWVPRGRCPFPPPPDWLENYDRAWMYTGCGWHEIESGDPKMRCTPKPEMLLRGFARPTAGGP